MGYWHWPGAEGLVEIKDAMKKLIPSNEYFLMTVLVCINIMVGLLTFSHYGETWDEQNYFFYANQSIQAYTGLFQSDYVPVFDPTIRYYGPVFTMPAVLLWKIFPNIIISDVQHILNWITFQFGLIVFYLLARRWLTAWASFGATFLFAMQPLLWGHAFVNPKDTPYMVGFMASMYFGLRMVNAVEMLPTSPVRAGKFTPEVLHADIDSLSPNSRRLLLVLTIGGILAAVALAIFMQLYWPTLPLVYQDDGSAVDLANYLRGVISQTRLIVLVLVFTLLFLHWLVRPRLPRTQAAIAADLSPFVRRFVLFLRHPAVLVAAIVLGLTLSIRLLAFAAAGLIAILLFLRRRADLVPLLGVYGGVAFIVMFITWPYLWWEPVVRFLMTLRVMLNFPWPGQTLFDGVYYSPDMLPGHYLPALWGSQFTEPFILLVLLGLGFFVVQVISHRLNREFVLVVGLWGLLPFAAAVIARPSLYDNARQLFFILPPAFLLCGLTFQSIFNWLKQPLIRMFLITLAVIPGLLGIIQLHPYEYIYYNSFVGGVKGAERYFELDYWGASYRNVATYLNANAPEDAQVVVFGPTFSLSRYTRPDIIVINFDEIEPESEPYYVVMLTRNDYDLQYYPDSPIVYKVEKMGALLSVVKIVE